MVKVDVVKAYDHMGCGFLFRYSESFEFSWIWCDLIYHYLYNCWYSISFNGDLFGYFQSTRRLQHGDALSPSLFILAHEFFNRNLKVQMERERNGSFTFLDGSYGISHQLFADNMLLLLLKVLLLLWLLRGRWRIMKQLVVR